MILAEHITRTLGGTWRGQNGLACCPAHEDCAPSLSLGVGVDGRLLVHCHAGCAYGAVMDALKTRGLMDHKTRTTIGSTLASRVEIAANRKAKQAEAEKRARQARMLWDSGQPITSTLGERYLRARGITCALPHSLRYVESCWHKSAQRLPAIVARVDGVARFAVHRTYLRKDGSAKAEVESPKAMLGSVRGGAVRLTPPSPTSNLVVAEGIETALSLPSGLMNRSAEVWAALSAGGLANVTLPNRAGDLIIAPDGDGHGREAAQTLARRAHALGWHVMMLPAPEGFDWNDVLLGKAVAA
ncbi:toprim domain-containing protein [Aliiroseovarius sediminis]|uniref:DUF7146 domain-containing protein n=1 Tax=Aliiroseovarius sediminis TaxID=2925839 RepID=UPI001F595992|nr:toprim domain-containing protein [Aliiroseovarius sediminis]MCI2393119.1 toprim domain-containing protein [Aliiroseovarius sediminis]